MQTNIDLSVWISKKFSQYYLKNFIYIDDIDKREFGFGGYDKKIEYRHVAFSSTKEFNLKLQKEGPHYVSCSAAYYQFPAARPMQKKEWLGADLIFDLDAEEEKSFAPFIRQVKLDEIKEKVFLLMDFLEDDFGIEKKDIKINFSGSRGYHLRVFDQKFKELGRYARKELVDYIDAIGLDLSLFFSISQSPEKNQYKIYGPKINDWGYSGKIANLIYIILDDEKKARQYFGKEIQIEKFKKKYLEDLVNGDWTFLVKMHSPSKSLSYSSFQLNLEKLIATIKQIMVNEQRLNLSQQVETDANVTIDTSKLLRVPDTIHGGSGLIAKSVFDLERFEPFKHALAFSMKKPLKIKTLINIPEQEFGNQTFGPIAKNTSIELPEAFGFFLICKKTALPIELLE
ncbi:MAG: DNA primase catalytic subunit PriS [Candidatus Anstonellaceae archaeon]